MLNIEFHSEDGGWDEITEATLSNFIQLRSDLLEGDNRLLYLAWLKVSTFESYEYYDDGDEEDDSEYEGEPGDDQEAPVPAGLKHLSPALKHFVDVFDIDPLLVDAAAESSPDLQGLSSVDYRAIIAGLSRAECDEFLTRLIEGDPGVRVALRRRLEEFLPKESVQVGKSPPLDQLLQRAKELEKAERERKAQEARQKHIAEMKSLAQRETQIWQQVDDLIGGGRKIASVYDEATGLLDKLRQLADFQNNRTTFYSRVKVLADKYSNRTSLMQRWRGRGWI